MKQPAASPGRTEKPPPQQQLPAPPGLARLLLSKSRRGARSRRAPATSPMFVSRGRSRGAAAAAAGADGEPSSPKVTCIGQVRMRKGKKGGKKGPTAPLPPAKETKGRGYCRCLKKAFLCGGLFDFDRTRRRKGPAPEAERTRRSPWVFSSRDVAVAAAPKPSDPACDRAEEEDEKSVGASSSVERDEKADETGTDSGGKEKEEEEREGEAAELVSSATATPPKNALLLMRCRSAPQNRSSPLTSRFAAGAAPSPVQEMADFAVELIAATPPRASPSPRKPDMASPWASPSPRKPDMVSPWASPSPRKPGMPLSPRAAPSPRKPDMAQSPRASPSPRKLPDMASVESDDENEKRQETAASTQEQEEKPHEQEHEADEDEDDEAEEMRCSSARPLVLQRCKSEPATTAAAKMAAGAGAEGAPSGCFWANGGSSGRRRHAPQMSPAAAAPVALTGH